MSSDPKIFLSARWQYLILLSYKVKPEVLLPHLPKGLELDIRDGSAYASLVAFQFRNTRLKGIPIPFHINFPEINLRFYVREKEKRGVVFIREFVPRGMLSYIARTFYNEPYLAVPMKCKVSYRRAIDAEYLYAYYQMKYGGETYSIDIEAEHKPYTPPEDSMDPFFKEHSWGYGVSPKGETLIYRVEHPVWEIYPIIKLETNFDFARIYGDKWSFLDRAPIYHSAFAKGSPVKVYQAEHLQF